MNKKEEKELNSSFKKNNANIESCSSSKERSKEKIKKNAVKNKDHISLLKKKLEELNKQLFDRKSLIQKYEELLLSRNRKLVNNAYRFSLEDIIRDVLPIVDSLEKAVNILNKEELNEKQIKIKKHIERTLSAVFFLLKKNGIRTIDKKNVEFNPNRHQAISVQHGTQIKENYIISVVQNGYILHDRLIRAAMVIVSSG